MRTSTADKGYTVLDKVVKKASVMRWHLTRDWRHEYSRQRGELVQGRWGRTVCGLFEEHKSRVNKGRVMGNESKRWLGCKSCRTLQALIRASDCIQSKIGSWVLPTIPLRVKKRKEKHGDCIIPLNSKRLYSCILIEHLLGAQHCTKCFKLMVSCMEEVM